MQPSVGCKGKQRKAVFLFDSASHLHQNVLITAHLHIPPHAEKSKPHKRMEPVYGGQEECQCLDVNIFSSDMKLFMADNILPFPFTQAERKVNPWPEQPQDKG